LGALIIKERLGTSDVEAVEQIIENPYLQYFIGLPEFQFEAPFHASSMPHFRKRITREIIDQVNEWVVEEHQSDDNQDDDDDHSGGRSDDSPNRSDHVQDKDSSAPPVTIRVSS